MAILQSISLFTEGLITPALGIYKIKDDYSAYYEQCPRDPRCDHVQGSFLSSQGGCFTSQLVFGDAGCCDESNRIEFFFVMDMVMRMRQQQADFMRTEFASLPQAVREALASWLRARRRVQTALRELLATGYRHPSLHHSVSTWSAAELRMSADACCDFFVIGGFFDDTASFAFVFMADRLKLTFQQQWDEFNVKVANGLGDDGLPNGTKSKVEEAYPGDGPAGHAP